MTLHWIKY